MADEIFHRAARDGNLDILREATRKDCNRPDEDGMTPTLWTAYHGNLHALRLVIQRGGNPDVADLLGNSALHHAARNGHYNCAQYLVSFGCNLWTIDNDYHTSLEVASIHEHNEIVRFLDDAIAEQMRLNKKLSEKLRLKAVDEADRNRRRYERMQELARKRMEKDERRRQQEREIVETTEIFLQPLKEKPQGTIKKVFDTIRGKKGTVSSVGPRMYSDHFNGSQGARQRGGTARKLDRSAFEASKDAKVIDSSSNTGARTLRSMKAMPKDNEVMYMKTHTSDDVASRAFSEPDLAYTNGDSGIVSDDGSEGGVFTRPGFGNISFLPRPFAAQFLNSLPTDQTQDSDDDNDDGVGSGDRTGEDSAEITMGKEKRHNDSDSIGSVGTLAHRITRITRLPWNEDQLETLDDEDEETEFTALELFLAAHGLMEFLPYFTREKVDFAALLLLSEEDLVQMSLPLGPRRKLQDSVARRKEVMTLPGLVQDTIL